jgi:predicted Zn-dependent peptidase
MRPALFLLSIIITISFGIPVRRDSLNNGLILLTCEDHRLPIVDLALICRSGAGVEPKEKAGIATLCARMLLRGTTKISAD